jgi:drug/metabolite transporter (DMT)-like permease
LDTHLGELAALGTALSWSFSSIFFTASGRMVGSPVVNRTRLIIAMILAMLFHRIVEGQFLPLSAEMYRVRWLAISGVIGFALGDALLFQAFVMIGPRLSMLLMVLAPVFGVILGELFLHEHLAAIDLVGVGLAVAGVAWVITDRDNGRKPDADAHPRAFFIGVMCGIGGALGQAVGLVFSKLGLDGDFTALSGNVIRLVAATVAIWIFTILAGRARRSFVRLREKPRAMIGISMGALIGPFFGVTLSLFAVQRAPVGIASTLMALTPVALIPISYVLFGERIGWRAVLGTLLAVTGTAVIFLG